MLTSGDGARRAASDEPRRSPLRFLDTDQVSGQARVETRNREVHLPPVSAYRWWARRTEAINGAILDACVKAELSSDRLFVVDPFAGGGVIPLAAVIRGHRIYAQDVNPWAAFGLAGMIGLGSVTDLAVAAASLAALAKRTLNRAYSTTSMDGTPATVTHTFRVATAPCPNCGIELRLYPHALVSLKVRRERGRQEAILACPMGHLFEGKVGGIQACPTCGTATDPAAEYTPRRIARCGSCKSETRLEQLSQEETWSWKCVLVERATSNRRELGFPTEEEVRQADEGWKPKMRLPAIPDGQETKVLLRHGFRTWGDIYPTRQRVVIETLLALTDKATHNEATARALRLTIIGAAEMAGYLSRWDRFYLKSYESMAGHRFNFTTFAAEPNVWGTRVSGRGSVTRRVTSLDKAGTWLRARGAADLRIDGPVSVDRAPNPLAEMADVRVVEGSSERLLLPDAAVDLVLTDPPYHDDVQYHELSLPLRAWAALSMEALEGEALVNAVTGQNVSGGDYADSLTKVFSEVRRILRPRGHMIFSYANREPSAWRALFASLGRAGFQAAGYTILHSENERDVAKRDVRACSLDLLLDLVPATDAKVDQWRPATCPETDEGEFLRIVGDAFLQIGDPGSSVLDGIERQLSETRFLRTASHD